MTSTGYDVTASPAERRALGYRWEDGAWRLEPTMGPGAFNAIGGVQTSANDYAKWLAFLLSAWPPRDDPDTGPVRRSSVRELAQGANYPRVTRRLGSTGADACRQALTYGMGMRVSVDCELGLALHHSGGFPGYGSHALILPAYGVALFAMANRTYAGASAPVWDAATELLRSGHLKSRPVPVSPALATAYATAGAIFTAGSVTAAGDVLAMNVLMDRDAAHWSRHLAELKTEVGACDTSSPLTATGALSGDFTWRCERGRVKGSVLLAPTRPPRIQALDLARVNP
jgi:CubicO group peptidase (beta-lactamase class C family)